MSLWSTITGFAGKALGWLTGGSSGASALGSIASAGINSAGSYLGSKQQFKWNRQLQKDQYNYNRALQQQTFKYNTQLQNLQNRFTTQMSNSAHQREVADLRAAGLNPILSANSGAVTPAAGSATVGGTSVGGTSVDAPRYSPIDVALAFRRQQNENNSTAASVWNMRQQAGLYAEQQRNEGERYKNIIMERNKTANDAEASAANAKWIDQQRLNSIELTKAQVYSLVKNADAAALNSAGNYYFNTNRALGFGQSESWNNGNHFGLGGNFGKKKGFAKGINFGANAQYGNNEGYSYNQRW